jgi:hypothetical protein
VAVESRDRMTVKALKLLIPHSLSLELHVRVPGPNDRQGIETSRLVRMTPEITQRRSRDRMTVKALKLLARVAEPDPREVSRDRMTVKALKPRSRRAPPPALVRPGTE